MRKLLGTSVLGSSPVGGVVRAQPDIKRVESISAMGLKLSLSRYSRIVN